MQKGGVNLQVLTGRPSLQRWDVQIWLGVHASPHKLWLRETRTYLSRNSVKMKQGLIRDPVNLGRVLEILRASGSLNVRA